MMEIKKIWLTDTSIWIQTADGREGCEKFSDYVPLRDATVSERSDFMCSPFGIHWPHLNEDLSFEGFFAH